MSILTHHFLNIGAKFKQLLPGQPCLLCGTPSRDGAWCAHCDAHLPYLDTPACPQCALPSPNGDVCGHCLKAAPHFERTLAVFSYAFPVDRLIQALKYGERLTLAHPLADRLAGRIRRVHHAESLPDCIVAMPLFHTRQQARSFNQSIEIARRVGRNLGVPLLSDACWRVRDTLPQSGLEWKKRKRNMRGAFAATEAVKGRHVAVVDDVMTTGASLDELAATLLRAGARKVSAWIIARTLRGEKF